MIDFEIVKRQIIKACKNLDISDMETMRMFVKFFRWYYHEYFEYFHAEHKRLTVGSIENSICNMMSFDEIMGADDRLGTLKKLAEKYFTCKFSRGTDYSITHFSCKEILQNRIYEILL